MSNDITFSDALAAGLLIEDVKKSSRRSTVNERFLATTLNGVNAANRRVEEKYFNSERKHSPKTEILSHSMRDINTKKLLRQCMNYVDSKPPQTMYAAFDDDFERSNNKCLSSASTIRGRGPSYASERCVEGDKTYSCRRRYQKQTLTKAKKPLSVKEMFAKDDECKIITAKINEL